MKLTAPWFRKTPSQVPEPSPSSSLDAISAQLDGLARKVDRLDQIRPPVRPVVQEAPEEALETAISGLRSIVAHVASADALASLGTDVRALTEEMSGEQAPRRETPTLGDLEQRIGSIADAIAALRADNRRRTLRNLASLVEILTEKIEVLQVQQSSVVRPVEPSTAKPTPPVAEKRPSKLDSIERGIADLMREVKEVRGHTLRCASERGKATGCHVERGLDELRQTQSVATRRTQDSLAAVHGTIDDLFERMASLESDIRAREAAKRATPLSEPAPERAPVPEPRPTIPQEPTLVPDAAPLPEPGPGIAAPDAHGFARLREPGRPFRPAAPSTTESSVEPPFENNEQGRRKLAGVLLKAAVGIGLAAALVGALLFFAPYLTARASLQAPQVKTADSEPSDDAWRGSNTPIEKLLGDLPSSIGTRLFKSAASGDPNAAYNIGMRLTAGTGSAGTGEQAVLWLERAAAAGMTPALVALGSIHEKGIGVAKDPQRARTYYLAAAARGSAKAMHNLAVLYANGAGGKVDEAAAADWFRKAAMRGVVDSQFNLAVLYERGAGVERNAAEAYKWYALAARQGDAGAARKRDEVAHKLDARTLTAMNAAVEAFEAEQQSQDPAQPTPATSDSVPAEPPPAPKRMPSLAHGVAALTDELAPSAR